ncbi:MAG: ABC transporter ATP-binding protein [Candidatus Hydrogenedentes bacterium]|nr:ABC transporter ATP-binding protein [Candidatus Hydrogenedentota bacterium]
MRNGEHQASSMHTEATPAVCMKNVTFSYNGCPALVNVNIDVSKGGFTSVIGPNGGGKSTLLKLILGLLTPTEGQVRVFGRPPSEVCPRIGYAPQYAQYDPLFPVSAEDVVLMGMVERHWGGRYTKKEKEAARDALGEMGVADLRRRTFAELSGGQRQRVLIARALVCNPELLLLDEPTAGVDLAAAKRLVHTLQEVAQRMTVIMVSHDPSFIYNVVSRVICVNQRVHIHPTSELTTAHLRELYGEDVRVIRHDVRDKETDHSHG